MPVYEDVDELEKAIGTHLGDSSWYTITQEQINLFADATDDHQWIHVDAERAKSGPYGSTIAHGYLVVALAPKLLREVVDVRGVAMSINYGSDKVRFPSPCPAGARLRGSVDLIAVERSEKYAQARLKVTMQREGAEKPNCVAELLVRYIGS
ncbi:MaoC family dehydratase [Pseudonocardia xishanensis]|uniref:3-hydroxyacyl-thioester dehydratase HtdZ n=1 Tax=Pseudonocardia xishanensis TaxID=630995 RepID=A0ABP8RZK3_9PSEU